MNSGKLNLKKELQKRDFYKLYDDKVSTTIAAGEAEEFAKKDARDSIYHLLQADGINCNRTSLNKHLK